MQLFSGLGQTSLFICFSSSTHIGLLRIVEKKLISGACATLYLPLMAKCWLCALRLALHLALRLALRLPPGTSILLVSIRVKVADKIALNWFVVSLEDEKTFATLLEELQSASFLLSAVSRQFYVLFLPCPKWLSFAATRNI